MVLSPTAVRFLNSIGVLNHTAPEAKTSFNDFYLYEDFGDSYVRFNSDTRGGKSTLV
jgi:hypothetical protein